MKDYNHDKLELIDKLAPLRDAYMSLSILAGQASSVDSDEVANLLYVINEQFQQFMVSLHD